MTLDSLADSRRVIGVKQALRAVRNGEVACVFIAEDADRRVTDPLRSLCDEKGIGAVSVATMDELGRACAIDVGSAAAALLKS